MAAAQNPADAVCGRCGQKASDHPFGGHDPVERTPRQRLMQAEIEIVKPDRVERAEEFVRACVGYLGHGFHPDTPFGDYVDSDGSSTFSAEESQRLDVALEYAFDVIDPYAVGVVALEAGTV